MAKNFPESILVRVEDEEGGAFKELETQGLSADAGRSRSLVALYILLPGLRSDSQRGMFLPTPCCHRVSAWHVWIPPMMLAGCSYGKRSPIDRVFRFISDRGVINVSWLRAQSVSRCYYTTLEQFEKKGSGSLRSRVSALLGEYLPKYRMPPSRL